MSDAIIHYIYIACFEVFKKNMNWMSANLKKVMQIICISASLSKAYGVLDASLSVYMKVDFGLQLSM